jgi:hypothetical protein
VAFHRTPLTQIARFRISGGVPAVFGVKLMYLGRHAIGDVIQPFSHLLAFKIGKPLIGIEFTDR